MVKSFKVKNRTAGKMNAKKKSPKVSAAQRMKNARRWNEERQRMA